MSSDCASGTDVSHKVETGSSPNAQDETEAQDKTEAQEIAQAEEKTQTQEIAQTQELAQTQDKTQAQENAQTQAETQTKETRAVDAESATGREEQENLDARVTCALARVAGDESNSYLQTPVQKVFCDALRDYDMYNGSVSRSNIVAIIQVLGRLKSDEPLSTWTRIIRKALLIRDTFAKFGQNSVQDSAQDPAQDSAQVSADDVLTSAVDSLTSCCGRDYFPIDGSTWKARRPSHTDIAELGQVLVQVLQQQDLPFNVRRTVAGLFASVDIFSTHELFAAVCGPMVAFLEQTFDTVGHAPVNDMLYRLGCYSRHDRSHAQTMCEAGLMSIVIKEMLKDGSSSSGLYSVSRLLCGSLTGAQVDGLAKQFPNVFVGSLAQDFMYVVDKAEAVVKAVSKAKKVAKAEANALVRDKELELLRRKCAELEGLDMQITRALARISGYVSYSLLRVPVQDLFREALRDYEANGCAPKGSVSRSNIASIIQVLGRLKSDEPISTWLRLIRKALENVEQDRGQDGAQDGAQDGPQDGPQDGAQDCEQNNSAQEEEEEEAASKDILASAVDSLAFRMYSFYCDTPISSTSPTSSTLCVSKPSGADTAELGQLFVRVLQNPGATFATKHALANKMAYVIGKTSDELFSAICGPLVAFLKQTFETKGHGVVVDVMQQMLYVLSDRAEGRGERTAAILLKAGMGPVVVKEMLKNSKSTSNPQGTLRSMFVMLFKFVDDAQLFSISEQFPDLAARISERGASITSQQIAARIKAVRDKAEAVAEAVAKAVAGAEAKAEAEAKSKAKDEFAQELELLRRKCADFEGTVQHLRRKCADFEGTVQHFTQDKVKHMALAAIARDHFATEEAKLRSKCAKLKDTLKRVTALVAPNTDGAAPSDQTVLS